MLPPTPRPSPKKQRQSRVKELAKPARSPKKDVSSSVPLKAATRPKESESMHMLVRLAVKPLCVDEQLPHAHAPNIIPVKVELDRVPIHRSDIPNSSIKSELSHVNFQLGVRSHLAHAAVSRLHTIELKNLNRTQLKLENDMVTHLQPHLGRVYSVILLETNRGETLHCLIAIRLHENAFSARKSIKTLIVVLPYSHKAPCVQIKLIEHPGRQLCLTTAFSDTCRSQFSTRSGRAASAHYFHPLQPPYSAIVC